MLKLWNKYLKDCKWEKENTFSKAIKNLFPFLKVLNSFNLKKTKRQYLICIDFGDYIILIIIKKIFFFNISIKCWAYLSLYCLKFIKKYILRKSLDNKYLIYYLKRAFWFCMWQQQQQQNQICELDLFAIEIIFSFLLLLLCCGWWGGGVIFLLCYVLVRASIARARASENCTRKIWVNLVSSYFYFDILYFIFFFSIKSELG